jgi:hypothetical protein
MAKVTEPPEHLLRLEQAARSKNSNIPNIGQAEAATH